MSTGTGGSFANTADWDLIDGEMTINGEVVFGTTAPTFPGATITIALPSGFTMPRSSVGHPVRGNVNMLVAGGTYMGSAWVASATTIRFLVLDASAATVKQLATSTTVPATWVAGDSIRYNLSVKVA